MNRWCTGIIFDAKSQIASLLNKEETHTSLDNADLVLILLIRYILRSATFAISSCTTCLFEMHAPLTLLELSLSWKRLLERNNSKMEGMKASPWQTCFYFWRERADLVTGHWSSRNLWRGRCFRAALTVYSELHELWATSRNGHPDWIFLFELRKLAKMASLKTSN